MRDLTVSPPTGAYYKIIRVPPNKKDDDETLEGATILCSIPSLDKTKPSYYHSFGEFKIHCVKDAYNTFTLFLGFVILS